MALKDSEMSKHGIAGKKNCVIGGYIKKFPHFIFFKNLYLRYRHENNVTFQYNLPSS